MSKLMIEDESYKKIIRNDYGYHIQIEVVGDDYDYPKFIYRIVDLSNPQSNINTELEMLELTYEEIINNSYNSYEEALENGIDNFFKNFVN